MDLTADFPSLNTALQICDDLIMVTIKFHALGLIKSRTSAILKPGLFDNKYCMVG